MGVTSLVVEIANPARPAGTERLEFIVDVADPVSRFA